MRSFIPDTRVLKSAGVRRNGSMAHMGKTRNVYRILVGRLKRRSHLGGFGVDGRIIGNSSCTEYSRHQTQ
jgi:hypothetical protein